MIDEHAIIIKTALFSSNNEASEIANEPVANDTARLSSATNSNMTMYTC